MLQLDNTAQLERIAANTWPAQHNEALEQWLLRANPELPSRRSNSVLTIGQFPRTADWMERIDTFYASHSLPTRYQIGASSPNELDGMLERLGYEKEMESIVMVASVDTVSKIMSSGDPIPYSYSLTDTATPQWTAAFMNIEQFAPSRTEAYQQMMDRIQAPKVFALAHDLSAEAAGIGTAILEGEWAGLINIATAIHSRRQGIGLQMIRTLMEWSSQYGARYIYLQVLATNETAQQLYCKLGFEPVFSYHYRTRTSSVG